MPSFNTLLILDLDETLIYATKTPLDRPADFMATGHHVYRRPGVEAFLADCLAHFTVAVWTASGALYARDVVAALFGERAEELAFFWTAARCTRRYDPESMGWYTRKSLRKVRRLGYSLDEVLIIDNTPATYEANYGNAVRVCDYTGDLTDDELPRLSRFLHTLGPLESVRKIEKRSWR
jgi:RNA polymerase II subunit A small phosphatase-like protein